MTTLKIVAVDNDEGQLRTACASIERHFQAMGYEVDLKSVLLTNVDAKATRELNALLDERPDAVFCDNHFGDDGGLVSWGFQYVSSRRPRSPDTVFILLTREPLSNSEFAKSIPHPNIIADKTKFSTAGQSDESGRIFAKEYQKFFREEFLRLHKRTKVQKLDMSEDVSVLIKQMRSKTEPRSAPTAAEIHSLLEQICFMGRQPRENKLDVVTLEKLEGGLSGSAVCTVNLSDAGGAYRMPGVIKISTRDNALIEVQNHNKYVKWMLPYTWRVDVLGFGETQNFGAVCYSFAHGGAEKPVSLATVLRARGAAQTKDVIEAIFDPGLQTWYEQRRTRDEDIGLYLSHMRPYFTSAQDLHKKGDAFRKIVQEVCNDAGIRTFRTASAFIVDIAGKQIDIHNLEQKIFSQNWGIQATECIGHGDLNAGNIMVKPSGTDFAFIDFRHTGWHHTSRDFCSVEGSIRTLYPRAADAKGFLAYFQQEIDRQAQEARIFASIADGGAREIGIEDFQASIGAALQPDIAHRDLISVLRCLYHRNFTRSEFDEYTLAMLAHTWWLTCFEGSWAASQRQLLVAQALALICHLWKL